MTPPYNLSHPDRKRATSFIFFDVNIAATWHPKSARLEYIAGDNFAKGSSPVDSDLVKFHFVSAPAIELISALRR